MTNEIEQTNVEPNQLSPVVRWRFSARDRIVIDEVNWLWNSTSEDAQVLQMENDEDRFQSFSHAELYALWTVGRMTHIGEYHSRKRARARHGKQELKVTDLPKKQQEIILWRMEYCDQFKRMEKLGKCTRSDASMKAAIAEISMHVNAMYQNNKARGGDVIKVRKSPSPTQLRAHLRKYESWNENPMLLQKRTNRSGNRKPRLDEEVYRLLQTAAESYADERRPTKASAYLGMQVEFRKVNAVRVATGLPELKVPSIQTLNREIGKMHAQRLCAVREGEGEAKKAFYKVNGGMGACMPLEHVEMDEWNASLRTILIKAGAWRAMTPKQRKEHKNTRIWFSVAIDKATRCVPAIHAVVGAPSTRSGIETLRMAVTDKNKLAIAAGCKTPWEMGGQMDTVCADLGSAWINHEVRAAGIDLNVEFMYPPGGRPQMRGTIERLFRSFHTQFVSCFHGRTFENVVAKGDYDPDENVTIDATELNRMLIRAVVDDYHNRPHKGLMGETPRNAWLRLTKKFDAPVYVDEDTCRTVFGTTLERELRKEGVQVFGVFYQHDDLARFFRKSGKRKVFVRVDQGNIGRVSVQTDQGWLTVGSVNPGMDGVVLREWVLANQKIRREFARQAAVSHDVRLQAVADIRAEADRAGEMAGLKLANYNSDRIIRLAEWGIRGQRNEAIADETADFAAPTSEPKLINSDDNNLTESVADVVDDYRNPAGQSVQDDAPEDDDTFLEG
ncbi:Mu transposase C-terminal domain-containing protein [Phyllobacterium myrsinacearum]|uniref:Putative transposase n=1 Tax=Phyllobacterium myrsinacearum TaxID=28101 RepID=A0A839ELE2_9HYPH|nr:Mu transposase C-terminal domain-containing protein [Phyllobacterium myrsinacearum]MBA8878294.1 putative transposase [Phyllobacterium myrsinacearum]